MSDQRATACPAMAVMERLRLPGESIALVEFLIRHHTKMSLIAFRRDTEDPEIVRQLADLVVVKHVDRLVCSLRNKSRGRYRRSC